MNKLKLLLNRFFKLFFKKSATLSELVSQKETIEQLPVEQKEAIEQLPAEQKERLIDFLPPENSVVGVGIKISIFTTTSMGTPKLIIDTLGEILNVPIECLAFSDYEALDKVKDEIFMKTRKSYIAVYKNKLNGEYQILLGCNAKSFGEILYFSFMSGVKIDYHDAYGSGMCVVTPDINF